MSDSSVTSRHRFIVKRRMILVLLEVDAVPSSVLILHHAKAVRTEAKGFQDSVPELGAS